ncbi:RNA modification enzyme, MiaB family [Coriobacterium glomerans PW2]|uniref:tRNA-2-methylthio-N(6)-dimethylallyladenosine synthase n=1 Tax=Coriobacterium glomerans (strain ATCC 49209 / DSM 20642 / JCM 10262 / PW2) TaxID=700015 RepID=F2N7X5_CORGP|nr:tRNA (N6-isopentenyl adenosine(37)-C2)-methylthiotransferase MiaB [Coriobacterium glomerans]AEB07084.1 RNA modification enzyme, MiaB family [Coriobacterium glomerans PW2]
MTDHDTLSQLEGKTYFVRTFGCQMNLHDSERVAGLLDSCGCLEVETPQEADIVVFMTCCVREAADVRLYGQCSSLKSLSSPPGGRRIVAVGGCIAQRDGRDLLCNLDNVDVVFGTHSIAHVAQLLAAAFEDESPHVRTRDQEKRAATDMPWSRRRTYHAWVPIMTGCNNFCSYCIVPYVRGRERSRPADEVIDEVVGLARSGVREVTLLGQNVNSYGRDSAGRPRFAKLLREVADTGIERIRFTSSHPKDLLPETIEAMADLPAVMPQLHLAVQSGSSRILSLMNRRYSRESYLELIDRVRQRMPEIALSTDIIVGFPGESEDDFEETLSLVRSVRFSQAFTFIYSRRQGTPAAQIEDSTPRDVVLDRYNRLLRVVEQGALENNERDLGRTVPVLIEGSSKKNPDMLQGKSPKNQTVHAPVPDTADARRFVGSILDVTIKRARTWYLTGSVVGEPH